MRIFRLVVVIVVVVSLLAAASAPAYAKDKPPDKKEKPVKVVPQKPKPPKPKDQDQSQPDPVEEPGEGAKEMVTICHKPGTPAEQTLVVAASALDGHLGHGDTEGACQASSEPPADEPEVGTTDKVVICHKPGTPAQQTLEIAAAALDAHLAHGDTVGACEAEEPVTEPGDESEGDTEDRVVICHKPGTPAEQTMTVPLSALAGHLAHGDVEGGCSTETKIVICHQPYTPAQQTLAVPQSAVDDHLAHGDVLGSCADLPDEPVTEPGTEPGEDTSAKVEICHQPGTPAQQTLAVPQSGVDDHLAHGDTLGPCPATGDVAAEAEAPWVARLVAAALSIILRLQEFAASLTL